MLEIYRWVERRLTFQCRTFPRLRLSQEQNVDLWARLLATATILPNELVYPVTDLLCFELSLHPFLSLDWRFIWWRQQYDCKWVGERATAAWGYIIGLSCHGKGVVVNVVSVDGGGSGMKGNEQERTDSRFRSDLA